MCVRMRERKRDKDQYQLSIIIIGKEVKNLAENLGGIGGVEEEERTENVAMKFLKK